MPEIIFADQHITVLNKATGVSLLADRDSPTCLWDELKVELAPGKPYMVHRIDKGTSGCLIIAHDQKTQSHLTQFFAKRQVHKYYVAWVVGRIDPGRTHSIDLPLRKGRKSRYRIDGQREDIRHADRRWFLAGDLANPSEPAHPSLTRFRCLSSSDDRSLLLIKPHTGRTHQIRVHLAWIGHPIVGDNLYGAPKQTEQASHRLHLHCHKIALDNRCFRARVPDDFEPRPPPHRSS